MLAMLVAIPSTVAGAQAVDMEFKPPPPPVTFARGGQEVRVSLHPFGWPALTELNVVLSAFSRTWSGLAPVAVTSASAWARMAVPKVRVPTVFSVIDQNRRIVGELVAYPAQDVAWDEKIVLLAAGAPEGAWFRQWATAIGLPVTRLSDGAKLPDDLPRPSQDQQALLILGGSRTGKNLSDVARLVENTRINVLVLEADWFGDAAGPAAVGGGQMRGDLLAITGKQTWAGMLEFRSHRQPCGIIANRWAWIADRDGLPLVEAMAVAGTPSAATHPVVLSYVPWAEQLGRSESADATFLAILSAAAKAAAREVVGHPVEFIYPQKTELNGKDRPVLSAVRSAEPVPREDEKADYNPPIYYILDLRGKDRIQHPDGDLSEMCRNSIEHRQPSCKLIILGDDQMLDEWKWLKLDRAKKTVNRPDVVWLSDDDLPPSKEGRIRLMLKFTELGVLLRTPEQEEERK